jgi:hypothetical protein
MRHRLFFTLLCIVVVSPVWLQADEKYVIAAKLIIKTLRSTIQKETDCKIILDDKTKVMTVQSEFSKFRVKYPDVIAAEVEAKECRNYFTITYKEPKADGKLLFRLDKEDVTEELTQFEQRVGVPVKRVSTTP